MNYDLSHLNAATQDVWGPIQDDEALLLFALCRVMCIRRVVEFGSLAGYSARNFLAAVGPNGAVYSVDDCRDAGLGGELPQLGPNHHRVIKGVADLTKEDLHCEPVELVFFDCHTSDQVIAYQMLWDNKLLSEAHLLCFHDTALHGPGTPFHKPEREVKSRYGEIGWVHGNLERTLVNYFVQDECYHAVHLEPSLKAVAESGLRVRHGLSILQKFKTLPTR